MYDTWTSTKGGCWWEGRYRAEGNKQEKKNGTTVIAYSIKYTSKKDKVCVIPMFYILLGK